MNAELRCYIDGAWVPAPHPLGEALCDASTGEVVGPQRAADDHLLVTALAAAARPALARAWADAPPARRADALHAIAGALEARQPAIAEADTRLTGVVVGTTELLARIVPHAFRSAAAQLLERSEPARFPGRYGDIEVRNLPLGPAAVIAPWNAPSVISAHKVASALAAGCPTILKPSEWAPLSCQLIAEAVAEADLPAGVFQLVHGGAELGARLVSDDRIRAVSFTGGLAGGRAVAAACAHGMKPAQLELGGNNPLVVLEGADLDAAAEGIVTGLTTMNGQWCRALGRLLVHRPLAGPLLEAVRKRLRALRLGHAMDCASEMGPLAHARHRRGVQAAIDALRERGGSVHQLTPMPELGGWFVPPTLVTGVAPAHAVEEIFGPVATVHPFDTEAEALALANQTSYGLAAYVFGPEDRALALGRAIRAGSIKVNGIGLLALHPLAPRPAWGLSGLVDEGAIETFEFFRGHRVIGVAARPEEQVRVR
jgi:phenylacetaldehyde dehydrogenase